MHLGLLIAFTLTGLCILKYMSCWNTPKLLLLLKSRSNHSSSHLLLQVQVLEHPLSTKASFIHVCKAL